MATRRKLDDLTLGPILNWTDSQIDAHIIALTSVDGAKLLFGGRHLTNHSIPECYGTLDATAVQVPLEALASEQFDLITTELFGPLQVLVKYDDSKLDTLLGILEHMSQHLTAAVASNDPKFQDKVLGAILNGTTYCSMRANDRCAAESEVIVTTWNCHREIIMDHQGPLPDSWTSPASA